MKVLEHCVYRTTNDTSRFEIALVNDGGYRLRIGIGYLMDPTIYSTVDLPDCDESGAWDVLLDIDSALRGAHMTYEKMSLEEVA